MDLDPDDCQNIIISGGKIFMKIRSVVFT